MPSGVSSPGTGDDETREAGREEMKKKKSEKSLWGGRFKKGMHPLLKQFSYSLAVDRELLDAEIALDTAWAKMLARVRLITPSEASRLVRALAAVHRDLKPLAGGESVDQALAAAHEDIHTLIQMRLEKRVGVLGKKIHTGRSRNDLVVASTRLYLKKQVDELLACAGLLQKGLVSLASRAGDSVISGYTHLRRAMPVLAAHHLLAYVEMIEEDKERLADTRKRLDVLPLGSAALAGSGLPIDQKFLARELGFSRITTNSLASVSDRAFITEVMAALSILWMHLSRLSEDFILWNSEPFGYLELDDAFATGSSLMPQKKNPDIFELTRGRAGVVFGQLLALLTIQKGLPLSYNRDLQEDKPALFDAVRQTKRTLELLGLAVSTSQFNKEALKASVQEDGLYATDLLEYLVKKKLPFSEAHHLVGSLIAHASGLGKSLGELQLEEFRQFSPLIHRDVYKLFDPSVSVNSKRTQGSTHPALVGRELKKWKKILSGARGKGRGGR